MINPENGNSFEEEDENVNAENENSVGGDNAQDEGYEDNSAQQRQIDAAARASEASFTLEPEKGIPEEGPSRDTLGEPVRGVGGLSAHGSSIFV
ncbi:MAG: hypothetical protein EOO88_43570 [Pedobacter sp.]|nr:MAG: hypothetical protein EOO88_43570 [Pedobacter sp.]